MFGLEEGNKEITAQSIMKDGGSVAEVASRLGVSAAVLQEWIQLQSKAGDEARTAEAAMQQKKISELRGELRRAEEERDILKKAKAYFASQQG